MSYEVFYFYAVYLFNFVSSATHGELPNPSSNPLTYSYLPPSIIPLILAIREGTIFALRRYNNPHLIPQCGHEIGKRM